MIIDVEIVEQEVIVHYSNFKNWYEKKYFFNEYEKWKKQIDSYSFDGDGLLEIFKSGLIVKKYPEELL